MQVSTGERRITNLLLRLDIFGVVLTMLEMRDETKKEKYEAEKQQTEPACPGNDEYRPAQAQVEKRLRPQARKDEP